MFGSTWKYKQRKMFSKKVVQSVGPQLEPSLFLRHVPGSNEKFQGSGSLAVRRDLSVFVKDSVQQT